MNEEERKRLVDTLVSTGMPNLMAEAAVDSYARLNAIATDTAAELAGDVSGLDVEMARYWWVFTTNAIGAARFTFLLAAKGADDGE